MITMTNVTKSTNVYTEMTEFSVAKMHSTNTRQQNMSFNAMTATERSPLLKP
jgi:hypothetical protein